MSVITNTTVLSNFAAVDSLSRLHELFGEVFLSTEVYREVQHGMEDGYTFYSGIEKILHPMADDGWLRLTSLRDETEVETFSSMPGRLHAGEASSLAIARHRSWLFLTDDKAARNYAAKLNIAVSGTLGCLILGIERNLWTLEHANRLLDRIVASGFHSPARELSSFVQND